MCSHPRLLLLSQLFHAVLVGVVTASALATTYSLTATGQSRQKAVLVLYASRNDAPGPIALDRLIRAALDRSLAERLDYYGEYLDVARFPEKEYLSALRDFLRRKYADERFDVVVATTDATLDFANRYGAELFPHAALVFAASPGSRGGPKSTGVTSAFDFQTTIHVALELQPDIRQIFVVSGASAYDKYYEDLARTQLRALENRVAVTYLSGLPMADLLRRTAALPPRSILYFLTVVEDGAGDRFIALDPLDRVAAVANVPIYVWHELAMDHGVVGGNVQSVDVLAGALADLALRVLKGESPESIPIRAINVNTNQFDWRQLQRWGISANRVPPGSIVRFEQPTLWGQYKLYIVGAIILLLLQTTLLAGLLVQRLTRRRVEGALRQNETALLQSYQQNRDLAGRLIKAQEAERTRIARDLHDDVSQQIAGFAIALSGLKRRLSETRHDPDVEEQLIALQQRTFTLANNIRGLSHELHPGILQHAGLVAALKAHCAEFERLQSIEVVFNADGDLELIDPDVALCLYRVAQEALNNTGRHARARTAHVLLARNGESIELAVIDDGIGFDVAGRDGRGLGLQSIDERVRIAKGNVRVESQPGHGTKVQVRIPV